MIVCLLLFFSSFLPEFACFEPKIVLFWKSSGNTPFDRSEEQVELQGIQTVEKSGVVASIHGNNKTMLKTAANV